MKELSDLVVPSAIIRRLLEKDVQKKCVEWARSRGYWARKFSSQSQRSVPDYLFAAVTYGQHDKHFVKPKFATEFKAPGKTSTSAQIDEQKAMRRAGWFVFECDNFETFKLTVQEFERTLAV